MSFARKSLLAKARSRPDLVDHPVTEWKDLIDPKYKGKTSMRLKRTILLGTAFAMGDDPFAAYADLDKYQTILDKVADKLIACKDNIKAYWKGGDDLSAMMLSGEIVASETWDSPAYKLTIVEQLGELSFLVTDPDGGVEIGNDENPLEPVENAQMDGGKAVGLDGYNSFTFADIVANQQQIAAMAVQISEDPNDGSLRTPDGSSAYVYLSKLVYDEQADTMTDTRTGTVYYDIGTGAFTAEDGTELLPGWQIFVGFDNFTRAFTEESIRGPFFSVLIWTFVFAFLSVATTFVLGLFLAIVFNDPRMKSKKYYRVLMILPYAFPGFLSALVWAGMMNQEFGFINVVLFGGADIPWLTNEWLAKFSIILVNLWLGFPYMFLICTGALQSIPDDLQEAARVDGANAWQVFRSIKFPLLLVAVAPLLIASFAYNFNNFSLIYMLTGGGPRDATAGVNVGATDILITMVYKVAFVGSTADYGLASAFSIIGLQWLELNREALRRRWT